MLGDPEVIALLLTEVNGQTCFSQTGSHESREGTLARGRNFYSASRQLDGREMGLCRGSDQLREEGHSAVRVPAPQEGLVPWPPTYAEGVEWARIYAEDPNPDGDGVLKTNARVLNVFNAHWPLTGLDENREPFFCEEAATITREFMNSPVPGVDLRSETADPRRRSQRRRSHPGSEVSMYEPYGSARGFDKLQAAGFTDTFVAAGTNTMKPDRRRRHRHDRQTDR